MEHEAKDDLEYVRRVREGDTDAFAIIIRRHEKKIFNLLYRWLGDYSDAQDAAQEVFLSAFRSLRQFRGDSSLSTWLHRIAINQAKNRRRLQGASDRRRVSLSDNPANPDGPRMTDLAHPGPGPQEDAERQEIQEKVQQAIASLDADEALLIVLHDLQQMAYEEMAGLLEIPLGTVKSRLHRARQALKAILAPHFEEMKTRK